MIGEISMPHFSENGSILRIGNSIGSVDLLRNWTMGFIGSTLTQLTIALITISQMNTFIAISSTFEPGDVPFEYFTSTRDGNQEIRYDEHDQPPFIL